MRVFELYSCTIATGFGARTYYRPRELERVPHSKRMKITRRKKKATKNVVLGRAMFVVTAI